MSKWIKTSERLPDIEEGIVFFNKESKCWYKGCLAIKPFVDDHELAFLAHDTDPYLFEFNKISHWMIPELPEDL